MSPAPIRPQVIADVLDQASAVFARHGYARTSLQAIADAAGYSKAGLLHHFSSKEKIYAAAIAACRAQLGGIHERALRRPMGSERDRYAIQLLVDLALQRPGLVALLLSSTTPIGADNRAVEFEEMSEDLFRIFGAIPDPGTPPARFIRVTGALAALSVLCLNAHACDESVTWREDIVSTALAALDA